MRSRVKIAPWRVRRFDLPQFSSTLYEFAAWSPIRRDRPPRESSIMSPRPILIHGLAEARAACAAASELGVPVLLVSAPAGAAHAGALWFRNVVARAAQAFPNVTVTAVLDCGDRAGDAQGALSAGVESVLFTGRAEVAERLAEIARARGATVLTGLPPALDLRGARNPVAACRDWLDSGNVTI